MNTNRSFRFFNRTQHEITDATIAGTAGGNIGRTARRSALVGASLTLVLAACGGSDDPEVTRDFIVSEVMEGTGLEEADAACVVDTALDQFSLEELASISGDNPDPEVEDAVVGIATDCILNSDNLDEIISNELDEGDDEQGDEPDVDTGTDGEPVGIAGEEQPPPSSAPPTTAPPATLPPTTLPPTTVPPTTVPELEVAGGPFCLASRDYYVAVESADVLFEREAGTAAYDESFKRMFGALDRAVDSAPAPELRSEAELARTALGPVHDQLVALDYQVEDLDPAEYGIADELEILENSTDRLEQFLTTLCGETESGLMDSAELLADEIILGATSTSGETTALMDDLERIYVEVPSSWASVDGSQMGEIASLVAGPDAEGFLTNWGTDGVRIRITDEGENADWSAPLSDLEHFTACDFLDAETYDDGAYFGTINTFENCSRAGTDAAVIIATNLDGFDIALMVEIQMVDWDQDIADLILSSFLVR